MTYLITECPDHGTKECPDLPSLRAYVKLAFECRIDVHLDPVSHSEWHRAEGHECWSCCPKMVIDPYDQIA